MEQPLFFYVLFKMQRSSAADLVPGICCAWDTSTPRRECIAQAHSAQGSCDRPILFRFGFIFPGFCFFSPDVLHNQNRWGNTSGDRLSEKSAVGVEFIFYLTWSRNLPPHISEKTFVFPKRIGDCGGETDQIRRPTHPTLNMKLLL